MTFDTSDLTGGGVLTTAQASFLTGTILPTVASNFAAMLNVTSVTGGLFASRDCPSRYAGPASIQGVCAGYSSALPVCGGTPSATIPVTYLGTAYSSCTDAFNIPGSCTMLPSGTGVPNSDLVRALIGVVEGARGGGRGVRVVGRALFVL
jgi:hypothetical protein